MSPHELDTLLSITKNEHIDTYNIDRKTQYLIDSYDPYTDVLPRSNMIVALSIFAIISLVSLQNLYNQHSQQIALKKLEQERKSFMDADYLYDSIITSYKKNY